MFDLGRDSNSDGNRSAQSSADCGHGAPMWLSSSAQFKGRAHRACRGGAHNQLHRLERVLMPFAHFVNHGGPTPLVVQMMGRLANRRAAEDRPSGWRDPGQYRDGPCRHATTIETFRAGPNMNRRIAIVGDRLSDGGTVNAHVGPPLPVASIFGTRTRPRLPDTDDDWFFDLSNSKEILFWEVQ